MNATLFLSTLNLSLGGLVFLLGFIILRENTGSRLNRAVALMLFFGGIGSVLAALSFTATGAGDGTAAAAARMGPPAPSVQWLESVSYVWEFFFPSLFLFASLFPEDRAFVRRLRLPIGPWWRPGFGTLVFLPHAFHFGLTLVLQLWQPRVTLPEFGPLHYFGAVLGVLGVFGRLFLLVHASLFSLVNLGFGLAALLLLFASLRSAGVARIRRQLAVIAIGMTACLVCYAVATILPQLFNFRIPAHWRAGLIVAALTLGPGSIAYAIVAHKFLDTRLLARRAILYALASGALVGVYLLALAPLQRMLKQTPGVDSRVVEPVLLVMALALFQPAIARLEGLLDSILMRDPSDYRTVVRGLARELQTTIDLDVLLARTIHTLTEALLLRTGHVVAFTSEGALSQTGLGQPLSAEDLARLRRFLPRASAHQTSYRLSERVEGLSLEEQEFLRERLGLELLVPLRWRGDMVGALLLGGKLTGTSYTSEDVSLLTTLAGQASVSLQNALLLRERVAVARFEQELDLARQIQRNSLLSEFPALPRAEVHALYIPSRQVGGDFYDVVPAEDGSYYVAIADVSGKGVPAALLSAMLQASLRTQVRPGERVGSILRSVNALLHRSTEVHQFATFFLARVDARTRHMTYTNGGHTWPILVRADGRRELLDRGGPPLGIDTTFHWDEGETILGAGDRVVFFTDGISEAANHRLEQYGDERLAEFVASLPPTLPAREVAERVLEQLYGFLGDLEPQDDLTLLVLRVLEREPAAAPAGDGLEPALTEPVA